jgi:cysteine desulfurase / selenocysteine lyase
MPFDVNKIREDFPVLKQQIYGKPLVYFDNGATAQKPLKVIDAMDQFLRHKNSSIHRGVHHLSEQATVVYEKARTTVQEFIGARASEEIIFTSGSTGSLNALAFSFGEKYLKPGDEIIISAMEHHANIVPWQMVCERKGAKLKVIPLTETGELDLGAYKKLISAKTKLVSVTHASNVLGTINPVKELIKTAHSLNIPVCIDGAQAVQHEALDMQDMDCDFYVFSGHKAYGPTGIGVLYGKEKWLEELPPYQGGGDMVDRVTFEKTTYNKLPFKFEAGTTNYVAAIGLSEALNYLSSVGIEAIASYEKELLHYGENRLMEIEGMKIFGHASHKASILSFLVGDIHMYDTGMILDKLGIAVRTGTHCAQPLMQTLGIDGTVRASLSFYNTKEEIDRLVEGLIKVKQMFE